ncbi:HAD family phosphatase, partial [Pseudomonas aeruginosa]|nr:HAD family phosphatase [Pseudomonas aeruginosa]
MDGVLISSREAIAAAWSRVAGEQGVALGPDCLRDHVHGRPGGYTLDYLFGHLPMERRRILKQRVDALEEGADCPLLPGVAAVIRQLRWLDVPLALVTSSWPARIDHVLRQHDLQAAFRTLVSRDDVVHGKPAPDGYRLAAELSTGLLLDILLGIILTGGAGLAVRLAVKGSKAIKASEGAM